MSAEVLRRAAALMRKRAEKADGEDGATAWTAIPAVDPDNNGWLVTHDPAHADYDTTVARAIYDYEGFTSQHIASWHPAVALAVADWLDYTADMWRSRPVRERGAVFGGDQEQALTVARTYLGEST